MVPFYPRGKTFDPVLDNEKDNKPLVMKSIIPEKNRTDINFGKEQKYRFSTKNDFQTT